MLLVIVGVASGSQIVQAADAIWTETFDTAEGLAERWETAASYHYDNPNTSCYNYGGQKAKWLWTPAQQVIIQIYDHIPCKTVLVPKTLPPIVGPLRVALDITLYYVGSDRNLLLHWVDRDNYLGFHMVGQYIEVEEKIGGVTQTVRNGSRWYNFASNQTYHIYMEHDALSGQIRLLINDELVINAHEDNRPFPHPLAGGRPGLGASVGGMTVSETIYDNVQILPNLPSLSLAVPYFSQRDELWRDQEYDTAQLWHASDPSIGRWGCAMVSAVMVLRYHGITNINLDISSGNQELTPQTLNTWLKQQPDGYLDNGAVNWQALVRLARWHRLVYGTTDLEFAYQALPNDPLAWLQAEILANRPTILEEPKHFIVTKRFGPGTSEIGINDPFYPQRQSLYDYNQTFLSARVLRPSQTDLRRLLIITPTNLSITAHNSANEPVLPESWWEPPAADPETGLTKQLPLHIYSWPQALAENLTISIQAAPDTPITIWNYDDTGSLRNNFPTVSPSTTQSSFLHVQTTSAGAVVSGNWQSAPWTTAALTAWWQWQRLPAPQIIPYAVAQEKQIALALSLQSAQELATAWQTKLDSLSWQNLILPGTRSVFTTHYQQLLRTLWP